jgi:hypothetical protein
LSDFTSQIWNNVMLVGRGITWVDVAGMKKAGAKSGSKALFGLSERSFLRFAS